MHRFMTAVMGWREKKIGGKKKFLHSKKQKQKRNRSKRAGE